MKAKHATLLLILGAIGLLLFSACAKKPVPSADTAIKGPAWATKGSGAFDSEDVKVFYGVGLASDIKSKPLLRQTADNRARAEIAKILETYVAYLSKDYMASTSSSDMDRAAEEQHVEIALKTFTKQTVHGAVILDHWVDPADGVMYALCKLDLAAFKEALEGYQGVDEKVRDFVRKNAERLHSEMERLENK